MLMRYSWPGNVRELKNLVERLAIMVEGEKIEPHHIPNPYNIKMERETDSMDNRLFSIDSLKKAKRAFEEEFIRKKLMENNNDVKKTARKLGVEKIQLDRKLENLRS
jgi:two-component system nitrogen regulation response regulator NtrX